MSFSSTTIQGLKDIIGAAVKADDGGVPGITAVVFDRSGTELFVHSAGTCGASSTKPLTPDHVFWMASCTKIVTAMSVMQLVERGSLSLDDGAQLEALCPELKEVQVLRDDGTLEPKTSSLTLRMLLTHTSGFGYSFYNEKLREYGSPIGVDWAGIAVERRIGVSLNQYMQTHIFKPLGLNNINMIPTSEMKANLAHMNYRDPSGKVIPRDHPYRQPLVVETAEEKAKLFNSGGGGLFAKPQEYCRVLAVLLNDGTCPTTGVRILSASTVADMFRNQIPQFPQFGRQGSVVTKPWLSNAADDLYPTEGNTPQGHGLSCMLTGGATGRSEGTGFWAGLANQFWWVDRENGVGGLVGAQILPFGDLKVAGAWFGVEAAVYAALREVKDGKQGTA